MVEGIEHESEKSIIGGYYQAWFGLLRSSHKSHFI